MPPLRTERSGKACDACRRQKTRCYTSSTDRACLRCRTLDQHCSLGARANRTSPSDGIQHTNDITSQFELVNNRLEKLEAALSAFTEHLDRGRSPARNVVLEATLRRQSSQSDDAPPVLMLRNVANAMGVQSPDDSARPDNAAAILAQASISPGAAQEMLTLYIQNYGRWIRFDETDPDISLQSLSQAPLLLCSMLLIAVRHADDNLARTAAPVLLDKAQKLLSRSLLTIAEDISFFQSVLILSLWSTTVGQVPLSMDGWLMTSYAIHHALAIPSLSKLFSPELSAVESDLDVCCVLVHLCLAHLQYCVGMKRKSVLSKSQIHNVKRVMTSLQGNLSNFEHRMLAEVDLYYILYENTADIRGRQRTEDALSRWKNQNQPLFNQPRSQFLLMGYQFAHLLITCQAFRLSSRRITNSTLTNLIDLSTSILSLAMNTADSRTQHLTDHIYHIITFSAITLCRVQSLYEEKNSAPDLAITIKELDDLVTRLIAWLKSIGLRSHVAHMLGSVVASQQRNLRPHVLQQHQDRVNEPMESIDGLEGVRSVESLPFDTALLYPDFIQADLFDVNAEDMWPAWE